VCETVPALVSGPSDPAAEAITYALLSPIKIVTGHKQ
jgi:hypothetical protein